MSRFGLPEGYVERLDPAYTDDNDDRHSGHQPHVYALAGVLGEMLRVERIIDIGCGRASKLAALHPRFQIVGVDYGPSFDVASTRYPHGCWIRADLESVRPDLLAGCEEGAIIICADVIEHLIDPTALVNSLREWLQRAHACVLSTPERVLCYGRSHAGPPPNVSHVREWTRLELEAYLKSSGLSVGFSGLTQSHVDYPEDGAHQGCQTTIVILQGRGR